jgi:hypothetical protein
MRLEARLGTLTKDNAALNAQVTQLEKRSVTRRTRRSSGAGAPWPRRNASRDLVARLEPLVVALKSSTKSRRELETD